MEQGNDRERVPLWGYVKIMFADLVLRVCLTMQGTLFPLYMIERGFSTTVAGLTTTAFMVVALVFRPPSGKLVDRMGRYLVIILGAAVYFLASGFFLFKIPAWLFLTVRGLQGLGFSFYGTALMTLATDIIPKSRMSEGIGYLGLTRTIAGAFPPLLALALKDAYGYQVTFSVIFVLAASTLLSGFTLSIGKKKAWAGDHNTDGISGIYAEDSHSLSPSRRKETIWDKIVDRDALKPSAFMLILMFVNSSVGTFLVAHAIDNGIGNPGVFFTANAIAIAVARLSVGKISQKLGPRAVLAPGLALEGLSMIGMYSSANLTILIISGVLYGLGMGMVQSELNSLAVLATRDERRGLANSTFFMAMDLGVAVGAYAMGMIAHYAGLGFPFLTGAMLTAITLLGYLLLDRKGSFAQPACGGRKRHLLDPQG
jgi:MFS family permease